MLYIGKNMDYRYNLRKYDNSIIHYEIDLKTYDDK